MNAETYILERRVGTMLRGKWKLERLLGVGGMAAVYVGLHKIGRRDAIKILHHEIAENKQLAARFEQEAHAVNRFRHEGAVMILDVDVTEDGAPFLVMELLEGESLEDRIQRQLIGVAETLRIADELLDVLAAAHAHGIIHRDIKPDNLFLQRDGRLKVLDFGIARMREGAPKTIYTQAGMAIGTLSYMPPEQVAGREIDGRADLFAVGCTLFRVVTGRSPHEGHTELELMAKMATDPAPPLASIAPALPRELCMVIDRALAFDRERRYPDARTMQEDVRAARAGRLPPYALQLLLAGNRPNPTSTAAISVPPVGFPAGAAATSESGRPPPFESGRPPPFESGRPPPFESGRPPPFQYAHVLPTSPPLPPTTSMTVAGDTRAPLLATAPSLPGAPAWMPAPVPAPFVPAAPRIVGRSAHPRTLIETAGASGAPVGAGEAPRRSRGGLFALLGAFGVVLSVGIVATIWWVSQGGAEESPQLPVRPLSPRTSATPTPIAIEPTAPVVSGVPAPTSPALPGSLPPGGPATAQPTVKAPPAGSAPLPAIPLIPNLPAPQLPPSPPILAPPLPLPRLTVPTASPPLPTLQKRRPPGS